MTWVSINKSYTPLELEPGGQGYIVHTYQAAHLVGMKRSGLCPSWFGEVSGWHERGPWLARKNPVAVVAQCTLFHIHPGVARGA